MGQGQEKHARRMLISAMAEGSWFLLQNAHLGLSFLDELLQTVQLEITSDKKLTFVCMIDITSWRHVFSSRTLYFSD